MEETPKLKVSTTGKINFQTRTPTRLKNVTHTPVQSPPRIKSHQHNITGFTR